MIPFITFFCRAEPGVLAHGPEFTPVHIFLYTPGKGELAGHFDWGGWYIGSGVQCFYFNGAIGSYFFGHVLYLK